MAVAGNWYEKGIDNFVVMSGGLLALARTHPDLIEGPLPTHFLAPPATAKSHRGATSRPSSAGGFGSTGRAAIGSKSHFATDQNTHANTRPTAGMASCGAPSRSSNPRPVAWNSLRESGPASMGSFYASRSFDSGLASLRVR